MSESVFTPEVLARILGLKPTPVNGVEIFDDGSWQIYGMDGSVIAARSRWRHRVEESKNNVAMFVAASDPLTGYQALALEVERLMEREKPVRPVVKKRVLKAGYGYCTCSTENGAPFIVSSNQKYCPNCGQRLEWK